jgi:hypothetical protein
VAVAASLVATGMAVRGGLRPERPNSERPVTAVLPSDQSLGGDLSGPTRTEAGMPAGFARTERGAVAAAVAYVTNGQVLLDLDPFSVESAIEAIAAEGSADGQIADMESQLAVLREALSGGTGPVTYRQAALAVRVDGFTPDRARVAVWHVGVLYRAEIIPPQAGWAISTFDLVWERDDWKIWSETITPGPAPILNRSTDPATGDQFAAALSGFTPVEQ